MNPLNGADDGTPSVLCLGETMVLVTPVEAEPLEGAELFHLSVGGAESTVAIYLADAGVRARWVSALGRDPLGARILRTLQDHDVDVDLVELDGAAPTGVYFKDPGKGSSRVHYYRSGSAASKMTTALLDRLPLSSVQLVHASGITPALSPSCRDLMLALPDRVRAAGTRWSFDVNYRPGLWSPEQAGPVLLELARQADVVFVGRDEAEVLWNAGTPEAIRDFISPAGVLVVKDGEVGATEYSPDGAVFVPTPPVEVVEVIGAGDAFAAGYLAAKLRGAGGRECLARGHATAARSLTSTSDFVPRSAA
jgi:2-dehydro-3-deoxygluconokinase